MENSRGNFWKISREISTMQIQCDCIERERQGMGNNYIIPFIICKENIS